MINVIILENNLAFVELLSDLVTNKSNIEIIAHCGTGNELLQLVEKHNNAIDVILMDSNQTNGIVTMANIKKNNPNIKVIGYSISEREGEQMLQYGADVFLPKRKTTVEELIKEVIKS